MHFLADMIRMNLYQSESISMSEKAKNLQETSIKVEKRVKQCCQLYLQDAKPCVYEGQLFAFLQLQLHTRYFNGTLYLSEFQTKVGNTELEIGT